MTILRFPFQSHHTRLNKTAGSQQTQKDIYIHYLNQADIFSLLTKTQLEMIADICQEKTYHNNEIIFTEGSKSDEMYIIIQGLVDVIINPDKISDDQDLTQAQQIITQLQRGASFGEVALVDLGLRSSSARAAQNKTWLLVISRNNLMQICEEFPQIGFRIMKNLASSLANKLHRVDLEKRQTKINSLLL